MKTIIKATAPTSYQLNSLREFGIGVYKVGDGSYVGSKEFDNEEEAKDYLRERAETYNDLDPNGSDETLEDMYSDIDNGHLTLDAVTAYIEEIESDYNK